MKGDSSTPPLVSIVIPACNSQQFIGETIRSVQAQTMPDWECIIVDDGSQDGTLELIHQLAAADPRLRVATQSHGGSSAARNHGLALTDPRSRYVTFMDSDDLWSPDALEVLRTGIEKYPDAVGAHALGRCIDQHGDAYADPAYAAHGNGRFFCNIIGGIVPLDPAAPTCFRSLWFSNPYPPGLILTRRSVYYKVGPFDAGTCPLEDWDMVIRLSRQGDFRFVEKVILSYRRHDNNLSARSASVVGQQIRNLLHKTFFSAENSPAHRKILRHNFRAGEMLHLRQNLSAAREQAVTGKYREAMRRLARVGVHLFRFAMGIPHSFSGREDQRLLIKPLAVP